MLFWAAMLCAIFGVVIQSMPHRVCALEQQITGTSCHKIGAPDEHDAAGHPPCDRGGSCQCQLPRIDAYNANNSPVADFLPPLLATISVSNDRNSSNLRAVTGGGRPPDTSLAVQLPLLN